MLNLLAGALITLAGILQVTLAGRITLLQAPADLVLLTLLAWNFQESIEAHWRWGLLGGLILGLSSALPFWVLLLEYSLVGLMIMLLRKRVIQIPVLTLFLATMLGTILIDGISLSYLWLSASPIDFQEAVNFVVVPHIVINMLLVLPASVLILEISKIFLPEELRA